MKPCRSDFVWALPVLTLSGAAALGHQLLWTRRLADLLGATSLSSARVFASFFVGLALGAAVASLFVPRIRNPWRTVGLIELGIALLSLPMLLVNSWSASLLNAFGPERLLSWEGAWVKVFFSLALVMPPAFLVGMTLPVLTGSIPLA